MTVPKPEVNPPTRMDPEEARKFRAAAFLAKTLFPNAIGDLCANELNAIAEFGYRVASDGRAHRLCAALEDERRKRDQVAAREWAAGGQYRPAGFA